MEELPEDADLLTDPAHELLMQGSPDQSEATPTPSPISEPVSETKVGPDPVVVPAPTNSDLGPEPVSIADDVPEPVTPAPETPAEESVQSPDIISPLPEVVSPIRTPLPEVISPVPESDQESSRAGSKADETSSLSSEMSTPGEDKGGGGHKYATLSRVRTFKVDGQVIKSTTQKIVDVTANKTLRDNKKYQQMR